MTPSERYKQLWRELELCDELGFDYAFAVEHHFRKDESWMSSPAAYCAAAAAHTRRLRLGAMGWVAPLYDPLRVAEETALVDQMLDGRLEIGLVSGVLPGMFGPYKADYQRRSTITNEALAFLKTALAAEGAFSFDGEFHQYQDVELSVKAVQRPHPPIWLESRTPATLEMLAREGVHTGYVFFSDRPEIVPVYQEYVEQWRAFGQPGKPNISYWTLVYVDETDERALERAAPHIVHTFTKVFHTSREAMLEAALRRDERGEHSGAEISRHLDDPEYLARRNLVFVGSPETVARNIKLAAQEGMFNTLLCELNFGLLPEEDLQRSIRLFGAEVLPALRDFEPY
jgi:alkanesulfonate monooxygenase SsuD/methylene tetrahydromethanopterin reductase-like flavin-dependent oxidoreductase (luciferase family)